MSVVRINAISVPAERREVLEQRFAERAGEVSSMPGFEAFELLRPSDDKDVYLVYTRWRTQADFDNWVATMEVGISAPLAKALDIKLLVQDVYDNQPAAGRKRNDLKLIAGIGYRW